VSVRFDPTEAWDNLNGPSPEGVHWSTDNVGEAVPGVMSPLQASIWEVVGERTTRGSLVEIGALSPREGAVPTRLEDRVVRVFCGRLALQVELLTLLGDRLPGTSGQDMAAALFGSVPDDIEYRPTLRRYPAIAWKLPKTFLTMPRRLRVEPPRIQAWWQRSLRDLEAADIGRAHAILREALTEFEQALLLQSVAVVGHAQLIHEALAQLIGRAGVGDMGALSGSGGAEMAVISDIWRASRGELSVAEVLGSHGFHGPLEGDMSSVVWREDPAPLKRMIAEYRRLDDDADPRLREQRARARLPALQAEVLAALPRSQRPGARMVLALAAKRIPLRGVAKRSYLQGIDVIRASARRIGADLVDAGEFNEADDVFSLTISELTGTLPADVRGLIDKRRRRREEYRQVAIPGAWKGQVEPFAPVAVDRSDDAQIVAGIGVSGGVVEGVARVVTDPTFAEVAPGEILIAPTTDPGWASIMFLSAGLVVDMGGPLSHAAVVARELGLPCVVNTRTGTQRLRTGDRVRVDGDAGTVEVLAPPAAG
jgi:phosphohistidine swiveling domain-containing protein